MSSFQALAMYLLEIGLLYVVMFFIRAQERGPTIATALTIALVPILAFYAHRLEKKFRVPFFVWAIGLGFLFQDSLYPLVKSRDTLTLIATTFGILIIFGGGLELKFHAFKRLLAPIISLSVLGAIVTALLFSLGLIQGARWFSVPLTIGTIGLLGAMLCSTDPAAILPTLRRLRLKNHDDATVAVAESAVNDVTGTIMTAVFAGLVLTSVGSIAQVDSITDLYRHLFSLEVLFDFLKELIVGVVIGTVAYQLLRLWRISKSNRLASLPFFIGTALMAYTLSMLWGGSGYLAAFITGLLFDVQPEHKEVEHFFGGLVDGFVKPAVFIMLGALITPAFIAYAPLGIAASLAFIFVIRPLVVSLSLIPFTGRNGAFRWRDLLFLDAVRETGVIPAVLLVSIAPRLPDGEAAFAVGSWVILTTLIVLPLITTPWARHIRAAE